MTQRICTILLTLLAIAAVSHACEPTSSPTEPAKEQPADTARATEPSLDEITDSGTPDATTPDRPQPPEIPVTPEDPEPEPSQEVQAADDNAPAFIHRENKGTEEYGLSADGWLYQRDPASGTWKQLVRMFDEGERAKQYRQDPQTKQWNIQVAPGQWVPLQQSMTEDFTKAKELPDLFYPKGQWTGMTLQSPQAKTTKEVNDLAKCILKKSCTFKDNTIGLSTEQSKSQPHALRAYAVQKTPDMATSKSSLSTLLVGFQENQHVWYSAWYYVEKDYPYTIVDLEASWVFQSPGMRIVIEPDGRMAMQLAKWINVRTYSQPSSSSFRFPKRQWVKVTFHLLLSADPKKGKIEVWADSAKIIDTAGVTLPWAGAFYSRLEIGISATDGKDTVLFVDDVRLSDKPLQP